MRRGQLSLDLLFAVTLIAITMLNIIYTANEQITYTQTLDVTARLKIFSIDLRDSIVKAYSVGDGYSLRKQMPFSLNTGDSIIVTLNSTLNVLQINATVNNIQYYIVQNITVPIYTDSRIILNSTTTSFWIDVNRRGDIIYVTFRT
ncbi:hypothetical protein [Thermococcus sp.]